MENINEDQTNIVDIDSANEKKYLLNWLIENYGVLMSGKQLAELLGKSYQALHTFLQSNSKDALILKRASKRIGRRCFYRTYQIADFLEG